MPAVLLRVAVLGAGLLAWQSVAAGRAPGPIAAVMVLLIVVAAADPAGPIPTVFLLAVGGLQVAVGEVDLRLPITVAAVHAHHVLCALSGGLPPDARVGPGAFRRPLGRFLALQAASLLLLGCVVVVRRADQSLPGPVLLVATAAVVAAVSAAVVATVRRAAVGTAVEAAEAASCPSRQVSPSAPREGPAGWGTGR